MLKHIILFCTLFSLSIQLHAAILKEVPTALIEGEETLLNRPEGIAFTPSGDYVVIANSAGNNVLFYRTADCINQTAPVYPVFILGGSSFPLGYTHDISFSPDGGEIAVVCRTANRISIHKKNKSSGFYDQVPFSTIERIASTFKSCNAAAYSPTGRCLAVCDVIGHKVFLYRHKNDRYESTPYQVISGPKNIIHRPDGVAFSSDGQLLAITSHGTNSLLIYERTSTKKETYSASPVEILSGEETGFNFPHSVSFHPLDGTLAVSSSGVVKTTLALFKKNSNIAPYYSSTPSQTFEIYNPDTIYLQKHAKEEGGVKGISFSPDGKFIGLCSSDIPNPYRTLIFYATE